MSPDHAPQQPIKKSEIDTLKDQIEAADASYDSALAEKLRGDLSTLEAQSKPESVMGIISSGDPVAIQQLDERFAVAPQKKVTDEPLHDAHVEVQREHQSQKEQEELEAYRRKQEAIQNAANRKVADIFSARSSNEGRKEIDMIRALIELSRQARKDKGAIGWAPYKEALGSQIKNVKNESERAALEELVDGQVLNTLAQGPISAEGLRRRERKDVESGRTEVEAKEIAQNLARVDAERQTEAEKTLAKLGVDIYNL